MKLKNIIRIFLGLSIILGAQSFRLANAAPYAIEKLPDATVYNDFVVGPGKYEIELKPGESKIVNLVVTNRLGKEKTFQIQIDDFKGSRDTEKAVVLLDGERGPYSLKDYLKVASTTFSMGNAERVTIPVRISIPTDAQPGGLYGSIVVGTVTTAKEQVLEGESSAGVSPVITRIGSLLFVRVEGPVKEDLALKDFSLKNHAHILGSGPVNFQLLYENNGTVHETPSGSIRVNNIFGAEVAQMEVEPWFILPDSLRVREVTWNSSFLFGRYVATAEIKKGYDNLTDTASVTFWVIPWKIIVLAFIGIALLVFIVRWLSSKISISVKKPAKKKNVI